jgi:hypothetical protein
MATGVLPDSQARLHDVEAHRDFKIGPADGILPA